ncbi:RsmB/NOP family class I SAM-dependent RNA methyltransferase [Aureimonas mangrovi]|uniref:RsmB/NOP family class I SAM-dependent RNA methyltransferase n=1 Tax=Aureimonas mangrovi TaxID=2758041 RepID=UPI00163DDEB9|nr:RsmB/NOP family class I SAM-dependent RNA methyltransferase [Aureimonas mangrovi]
MRLGGRIAAAIEVIENMDARRRPVADALKEWGQTHRFAGSGDRSAIGNIVYDVLRRRRSIGWRMGADDARHLIYGAVIDAGRRPGDLRAELDGDRYAPAIPEEDALQRFASAEVEWAPPAVQADVPDWLAAPLAASLGEAWIEETRALADRPPLDMRVNALKARVEEVESALAPFAPVRTELAPHGLRIAPIEGDGRHPNVQVEGAFQTGLFEIQDEGSQIAAALCGARPGESVLDYCAGAGGKTLALAAAMSGQGALHAHDADRQRLAPIWERLSRAGAANVTVHAPREDLSALHGSFDRVVVDAPCTGAGTWRRRPDAKWRLGERQLAKRQGEQDQVLDAASAFVRPGGRLFYITCSVLTAENAERVEAFLARHPDFTVRDARGLWAEHFPTAGARYLAQEIGEGAVLTLTPRLSGTDGFFFAALERAE